MENIGFEGVGGCLELRMREVLPERRDDRLPKPEFDLGLKKLENLAAKLLRLEDVEGRALDLRNRRKRSAFEAEHALEVVPGVLEPLTHVQVHF